MNTEFAFQIWIDRLLDGWMDGWIIDSIES